MDRQPVVAGQFYPGRGSALRAQVAEYMDGDSSAQRTLLVMAPHAGYIFSGKVAGKTIAKASLARRIILMGPNHTGRGQKIAVWCDGRWIMPGFDVPVDSELADILIQLPGFSADYEAHFYEHSLEVVLPFLEQSLDDFAIVPVAVSESDPRALLKAGKKLGQELMQKSIDFSLVVSSDMSHYISHDQAKTIDRLAIDQILAMDPEGLYQVVRKNKISMCGVLPMVLGLACVRELGAQNAELVTYSTSGEINQDYSRVVGYAGILIS
jgi:AmmeMemoRadiSam system protein B